MIINRAFFGKNNCLKFILNKDKEVYIHLGLKNGDWTWKKVKLNDDELGDIVLFLQGDKEKVSFFHDFKGDKTQIWFNKKEGHVFVKINDYVKGLAQNEQIVLLELVKYSILRSNLLI